MAPHKLWTHKLWKYELCTDIVRMHLRVAIVAARYSAEARERAGSHDNPASKAYIAMANVALSNVRQYANRLPNRQMAATYIRRAETAALAAE